MQPSLLTLPPEILIHILRNLDLHDLVACRRTHHALHNCIRDHQLLQYHIAKQEAAVEDNPNQRQSSVADRLALLKSREKGWERLCVDFQHTVDVEHQTSGIYDLSGGVYLLGSQDKSAVHYCVLPKKNADRARWEKIELNRGLIDIGLAIYEHDLVAVVTTTQSQTEGMSIIEIQLLQFSTGKPHPLAKVPTIHVSETPWGYPGVGIEIVGDNLALVLTHVLNPFHPNDSLHVYNWKTGDQKMEITVPYHTYAGIVFLSPAVLLLPNMRNDTLDYWSIPDKTTDPVPLRPLRALGLPELSHAHYISSLSCRCEPNPTAPSSTTASSKGQSNPAESIPAGSKGRPSTSPAPKWTSSTPHSYEPFHPRWQDAIVIFNVRIQSIDNPMSATFSLFAHRRALLKLCPSTPDPPPAPPAFSSVRVVGHRVSVSTIINGDTEFDDGSSDGSYSEGGEEGENSRTNADLDANSRFPQRIPWPEWGPPISRWFDTEDMPTRWITTSTGQRAVIYAQSPMNEDGDETKPTMTVLDFNEINVRKLRVADSAQDDGMYDQRVDEEEGRYMDIVDYPTALMCDMFEKPIKSALPYASVTMTGCPFYEGVLMDEERLLGLKTNDEETICAVDVIHLGMES